MNQVIENAINKPSSNMNKHVVCKPNMKAQIGILSGHGRAGGLRGARCNLEETIARTPAWMIPIGPLLGSDGKKQYKSHFQPEVVCRSILPTIKKTNGKAHKLFTISLVDQNVHFHRNRNVFIFMIPRASEMSLSVLFCIFRFND